MIQQAINTAMGIIAGSKLYKQYDEQRGVQALSNVASQRQAKKNLRSKVKGKEIKK